MRACPPLQVLRRGRPHPLFDEQVILDIIHKAHDRSYATNEEGEPEYQNAFVAIPSKVPATPHRTTKRPKIEGTQVALVAGPEGEEIHPDEYGRIKVWFPWDRRAKKDGSDTCWIRVAQNWAGAGWGGQIIPRIGMEVMVTHLDGDPDRPLVTGVVPNAKQKVPYKLPENKTKSVFRTNTHQSKSWRQMNELTFEDKENKEEIFIHAEKDRNEKTNNNHTERIDNNWVQSVGLNKALEIRNNHDEIIGGDMTLKVGSNYLGGLVDTQLNSQMWGIGLAGYQFGIPADSQPGSGNLFVAVQKTKSSTIGLHNIEEVGSNKSVCVGRDYRLVVKNNIDFSAGENFVEDTHIKRVIQAGSKIEISCGKSRITLLENGTIIISCEEIVVSATNSIKHYADKILSKIKTIVSIKSNRIDLN